VQQQQNTHSDGDYQINATLQEQHEQEIMNNSTRRSTVASPAHPMQNIFATNSSSSTNDRHNSYAIERNSKNHSEESHKSLRLFQQRQRQREVPARSAPFPWQQSQVPTTLTPNSKHVFKQRFF
jgi:hypothetical protein